MALMRYYGAEIVLICIYAYLYVFSENVGEMLAIMPLQPNGFRRFSSNINQPYGCI